MPHVPLPEHRLRVAGLVCGLVLWVTFALVAAGHRAQDFPQFYALGRLVVEDRTADLQDGGAIARVVREQVSPDIQWHLLPIYGPQVALAMAPFAQASYRAGEVAWLLTSALLYALAVAWLLRDARGLARHRATAWVLAAASPGFFQLIWYGQLSMVALVCSVAGCSLWARGRPFLAGLAFGLLVYKPQYGIAVAVVAIAGRHWPVVAGALSSAAAQLAIAWAYAGTGVMQQYLRTLADAPRQLDVLQSNRHLMQSLLAMAELAPGRVLPIVLYAVTASAVLAGTLRTWQRTADARLRFSALILCGLLVSPHVYVYDLVLLTPVFAWMADWMLEQAGPVAPAPPGRGQARAVYWSLGALYLWPVAGLVLTYYVGANAGPVLMLLLLALVSRSGPEGREGRDPLRQRAETGW